MKALTRRHFLKAAALTTAVSAVPVSSPAPTLMEAGAGLCVVLTITGAVVVCVCRLCRPKYILYFKVDENKKSNAGREYLCLSCTRAEAEQQELTKCQGKFSSYAECQNKATIANTNYQAVACMAVPGVPETELRASVTLETTATPTVASSWSAAAESQVMNLNDDDPQLTFRVPRVAGAMYFRARASTIL